MSRTVYRYQPDVDRDNRVIELLQSLTDRYPRYGFSKLFTILRRQGNKWNHKRVYRVYKLLNLHLRRKGKRRLPNRNPVPLMVPDESNHCWSIDFMSDSLWCGRKFRTFNVLDDFNREVLDIEIDLSLPGERVVRVLDQIAFWRGYPLKVRLDNGPEMTSVALSDWGELHAVELMFIQPGKPTQNSYIERFNRTYRNEVLNMYVFRTLTEVRDITENWIDEYNRERPHDSLGKLTPVEYREANETAEILN